MKAVQRLIEAMRRNPRVAVPVAGLAIGAIGGGIIAAFLLMNDGDSGAPAPQGPAGLVVTPDGDDVGRLQPIRISFPAPPSERDGTKLLSVEPALSGDYAWLSDRTLLFQPEYPGFLRGFEYTVQVPARPEAGVDADYRASFTTAGKLEIVSTVPADGDEDVPREAQILVQFSRSVAPLTLLSEASTRPVLVFDPPLAGKGEWLNTSLYRFVPDELAPITEYRVTIEAGLTSAADGVLADDYSWTFSSYGPSVVAVTPDNQTQYAAPRQPVTVAFNQPMNREAVEGAFVVTDESSSVRGDISWNDAGTVLTFTPSQVLAPDETHYVKLPAGLPGANGGKTLYKWESSFRTVGPLRLARTEPAAGSTSGGTYGFNLYFSHPIDIDSVEGRVSVTGVADDDLDEPYVDQMSAYFPARLKPSTAYTVTIAPGIVDRYGQPLGAQQFSFTTAALQPSVSLAVNGLSGTYAASTEPILYFHASNLSEVGFTLWPLTEGEANGFLTGSGAPYVDGRTWVPSQPPVRTWTQAVEVVPNEVQIGQTSLSGGGPLPEGDYFVRTNSANRGWQSEFAFSVVDTAIVLKHSYAEMLAWVVDYDTGEPLAGATVKAYRGGFSDSTAVTNADGLAVFPRSKSGPVVWEMVDRAFVRLQSGGHYGVASTIWQQGASTWELGVPIEYQPLRFKGHVYTDRPIYRPGERVEFKAILRADDDARYTVPDSSAPIDVVVHDPQGTELMRERANLNEYGSAAASLILGDEASTGDYSVGLQWYSGPESRFYFITSTSFRVAEFVRPEFEVEVTTGAATYADGDTVTASGEARYFFGGAVNGAAVEWAVLARPTDAGAGCLRDCPEDLRYSFSDYDYWRTVETQNDPVRARGTATTAADGTFTFTFPAELLAAEGAIEYTVAATVTDQNAQAVAGSTTTRVYPADVIAGIRTTEWIAVSGEAVTVELLTVTKEGSLAPNVPVTVEVYERRWVTTKVQTAEGGRQYRSEPVDELLTTLPATTGANGEVTTTFTAPKAGNLRLVAVASDSQGRRARSATYVWVGGPEVASWRVTNNDLIELVADKDSYEPGDRARLLVPAPFGHATGLVTVERGTIHTREVREFATNAETIEIPLGDRAIPNVFVSVVLYRPPTVEDPVPRYKLGYANLAVTTDSRKLDVTIEAGVEQAMPGETVEYTVQVRDWQGRGTQAEVSIAVVDKAVLSLAEERSIDGLAAFWFERGLGVWTSSSLAVSLDRSNDLLPGAGGGGKGGGGFDEEQLRTEFRNTAFWAAQIETDANGLARVKVPLPDNLTTWRLQARAISGDIVVGEATNELLSTRPLLLRPALPRFLRVGDAVTLRLLVRNATDAATTVTAGIEVNGITLGDSADRMVTVQPGASETVTWPATVHEAGTASVTFRGTASNGTQDGVRVELPVHLDVTPETTATNGVVTGEPQLEGVYVPDYALTDGGSLDVSVQPTLVGAVASELPWFDRLPWLDESALDVATRLIATAAIVRASPADAAGQEGRRSSLRNDVADLLNRQRPDGGWSWCPRRCSSDPWLTAWALIGLGEAARADMNVDEAAMGNAVGLLVGAVNRVSDVAFPTSPDDRAFFLHALAVAGFGESQRPVINAQFEQYRERLSPAGQAYLLLALHELGAERKDTYVSQLLNDLVTAVEPSANGNHWEMEDAERTKSPAETSALVLMALSRVQPGHPLIEETVRWLTVSRSTQGWEGRSERAYAVMALAEYAASTGELDSDVDYGVLVDEAQVLEGEFTRSNPAAVASKSLALAGLKKGEVSLVEFIRSASGAGRLYYKLDLRYQVPAGGVEAVNRGFAVAHEYTLLDDPESPVARVAVGAVVRVKVTVMTTDERNNVLVRDYLPAGLEPIDPGLDTTDPALIAQLEAERQRLTEDGGFVPKYWAPWYRWYFNPWKQVDIRDDRVELRTDKLDAGVYEYVYYARATAPGAFLVVPAHAEEGLFPEVFGRSDSGTFTVE